MSIRSAQRRRTRKGAGPPQDGAPPALWAERLLRRAALLATFLLVAAFYQWTATSSVKPPQTRPTSLDYYNLLAEGFLNGHLYLSVAPPRELLALQDPFDPEANARYRLHDASLYRGRYYLYYGVAPVVTLFLPARLISGDFVPEESAGLVYMTAGYLFPACCCFCCSNAAG